jgi:hypothetical protein
MEKWFSLKSWFLPPKLPFPPVFATSPSSITC